MSPRRGWARLVVENHRGVAVPRTLGFAILIGAGAATVIAAATLPVGRFAVGSLLALSLVFAAGLVDDLAPPGPRGIRAHLRSIASGRMTTGALKLVVIVGSSIVVVVLDGRAGALERAAAVVVLAGSANVWNGLDVRPGRALKAFLPVGLAGWFYAPFATVPAVAGAVIAAVLVLPLDLRERAMLGDAGSNLLGFVAGLGLIETLDGPWLVLAAVVAVALNVVAETVSFSRVVAAVPPLRWIDDLGRHR
jgi:UDP-N-acetylmuramyl pentapeptide phosphotransferase/UDP-N-acetylglucosamine-1-phosphate transferase